MKLLFFLISLVWGLVASAQSMEKIRPLMSGEVSRVISSDSSGKEVFNKSFRYRAIVLNPIANESGGSMYIEKLSEDGIGGYNAFFSSRVSLLANRKMKKEYKNLNSESTRACCSPVNMKWSGFKLTYDVVIKNRYLCEIKNASRSLRPKCRLAG